MTGRAKRTLAAALALVAVGFGLYAGTLDSPFVFDDVASIEENAHIEGLWPLSHALGAPPGAGSSGRPLVSLSLALNHALGGREVLGYHLFNVATLVLSGLALFGLARLLLARAGHAGGDGLAFALALVWTVHPLHTDTLNHVVYRNGSMMGMFFLASLYASVRGYDEDAPPRWSVLCVLAAVAAMACKEVAVSLPLVVLAFDRQFGAGGFGTAFARRPRMYAGLAASWIVLALCVLSGDRGDSVGFDHTEVIDGVDYLRTQMVAITTYLRLSGGLDVFVFDYHGQEVIRSWAQVGHEAALLGGLFALSVWGFARRKAAGLFGLCFFALLAPTSSVIPLAGELIGEHRMYLPLVPLVVIGGLLVHDKVHDKLRSLPGQEKLPWLGTALLLALAASLAWATWERNGVYESRVSLWQDTVDKRPGNSRAWNHLALALKNEGRTREAEEAFRRTLEIDPEHGKAHYNYGNLLMARGQAAAALERFAAAARLEPDSDAIRFNHGYLLMTQGRHQEAAAEYRAALEARPGWERPLMFLAWILATSPQPAARDGAEALRLARELNAASGDRRPTHLDVLAAALAETGDFAAAEATARRAVEAARAAGNSGAVRELEARRQLYAQGIPFRQPDAAPRGSD